MNNTKLRRKMREYNVFLYELAKASGVSESTMTRKMRTELTDEETEKLIKLVEEIGHAKEENNII